MLSNRQKSFLFAVVMCLVCGFMLTLAAVGLKEKQQQNILVDKQKNILKALAILDDGRKYSVSEIGSLYKERVTDLWVDGNGDLKQLPSSDTFPIHIVGSLDGVEKYAVPFSAYGLWSWVLGYFAIDGDGTTVVGMTVYSHGETPGLGGECEKPWFQDQFKGKRIADESGRFMSVGVVKGKAAEKVSVSQLPYYIDGISGATITSKGIDKYIRQTLSNYEPFSSKLRLK